MWSWRLTSGEIFENPRLTWVWYLSRCFFSKTATSVWMNISQLIFYSWLKLTECWNCFIIVVVKLLLFFEKKIQKNVIQSNKLLLYIGLFWIGSIQEQLGPLHIFIFPQTVTVREFMSAASRKPASTLESLIGKCPAKSIAGNMWQLMAQRKTIVLWILRAWSWLSPEVISNFIFLLFHTIYKSFKSCGLNLAVDGSKDSMIHSFKNGQPFKERLGQLRAQLSVLDEPSLSNPFLVIWW